MIRNLFGLSARNPAGNLSNRRQGASTPEAAVPLSRVAAGLAVAAVVGVLAIAAPRRADVVEAGQPAYVVNSTVDAVDAAIGNDVCETAVPGQCTLRAAVHPGPGFGGYVWEVAGLLGPGVGHGRDPSLSAPAG